MTENQRFRADVVIVLGMHVEAPTQAEAEDRARRMALARQRIRADDIRNLVVVPLSTEQALSDDNWRMWQITEALRLGTSNQRQRWQSGVLPDSELLILARTELFRPYALCPRRVRKGPGAIPHPTDTNGTWACAAAAVNGTIPVTWETRGDPRLTDPQWSSLQRLLTASEEVRRHPWMFKSLPTCVRIELREHRGECMVCRAVTSENAALVEIDWAGHLLSREYAL
jgi:hypothetical protein